MENQTDSQLEVLPPLTSDRIVGKYSANYQRRKTMINLIQM